MATLASVEAALKAKLVSGLSVTATFDAPLRRRHKLTAGQTHAALVTISSGRDSDSNVVREVGAFVVTVIHYLSAVADEGAYVAGDMIADQKELSDLAFYRTIAGVYDVLEPPEIGEPERSDPSNVIEYNVAVQLIIAP